MKDLILIFEYEKTIFNIRTLLIKIKIKKKKESESNK